MIFYFRTTDSYDGWVRPYYVTPDKAYLNVSAHFLQLAKLPNPSSRILMGDSGIGIKKQNFFFYNARGGGAAGAGFMFMRGSGAVLGRVDEGPARGKAGPRLQDRGAAYSAWVARASLRACVPLTSSTQSE